MYVPDDFITRRSALDLGLTDNTIRTATRVGELVRIRHGALADPVTWGALDAEEQYRLRVLAAAQRSKVHCAASHESAAAVLRMPLLHPSWYRVQFTAVRDRDGYVTRPRILHRGPLDPRDIAIVDGYATTNLARTALDIACDGSFAHAVCAVESAMRLGVAPQQFDDALARMARRHGIAMARRALTFADPRTESVGESWSRVLMHGWHDVPTPRLQHTFCTSAGEFIGRTDFDWNGRLVGEFDGWLKYRDDAHDAVVAEKRREDRLRALGVHIVRWTWDDLKEPRRLHSILRNGFRVAFGQ